MNFNTKNNQSDNFKIFLQTIKNHPEGWFYCYADSISQQALTT
jgi:hypothetical protein